MVVARPAIAVTDLRRDHPRRRRRRAAHLLQRGSEGGGGDRGRETSDRANTHTRARSLGGRHLKGPPDVTAVEREDEPLRQDPDDRMRLASEHDLAADDVRVGGECVPPERMADDGHWPADIVCRKSAPEDGSDAKQRQESWRDVGRARASGCAEPGERQVRRIEGFDGRERSGAVAPCLEGGIGDRARSARRLIERRLAGGHEGVGIGERWGREDDGIHDREDRRAGAERQ